jgi:microcompartment protein CcmK/EutM
MQRGRVVGTAVSTVKHASLTGAKLLVVQLTAADNRSPDGEPVLAVDPLGAGLGHDVLLTSDGAAARDLLHHQGTPVRWSVLGICDS